MFYDADGRLVSMPATWTDIDQADACAPGNANRSCFRTEDLRILRALVDELTIRVALGVK